LTLTLVGTTLIIPPECPPSFATAPRRDVQGPSSFLFFWAPPTSNPLSPRRWRLRHSVFKFPFRECVHWPSATSPIIDPEIFQPFVFSFGPPFSSRKVRKGFFFLVLFNSVVAPPLSSPSDSRSRTLPPRVLFPFFSTCNPFSPL